MKIMRQWFPLPRKLASRLLGYFALLDRYRDDLCNALHTYTLRCCYSPLHVLHALRALRCCSSSASLHVFAAFLALQQFCSVAHRTTRHLRRFCSCCCQPGMVWVSQLLLLYVCNSIIIHKVMVLLTRFMRPRTGHVITLRHCTSGTITIQNFSVGVVICLHFTQRRFANPHVCACF